MRNVVWGIVRTVLLSCFLLLPLAAPAAVITSTQQHLGGNRWAIDYTVAATDREIEEFTIYFDATRFSNLAVASTPTGWDGLVIQPDPGLSSDGYFDALTLGTGLAAGTSLGGFRVEFDFGGGSPGAQAFDLVDPATFRTLESGTTTVSLPPPGEVPEPATFLLVAAGLAALWWRSTAATSRPGTRRALALGAAVFLSACGGEGTSQQAGQSKFAAATSTATQGMKVVSLTKTAEVRVSRTVYDYTFRVTVANNSGSDQKDVKASVTGVGTGTMVIDGSVEVGALKNGASVSPADVIILRHDRTVPFDTQALVWQIAGTPDGGSPPPDGLLPGAPNDPALDNVVDKRSTEVYPPASYQIDPATQEMVLRPLVQIAFKMGTTVGQINGLLTQINGRIVSSHAKTALLFVRVPDPGSLPSLDALVTQIGKATFVRFVTDTRFAPAESVPSLPFTAKSTLPAISSHLAARGHLAWNARGAIGSTGAAKRPTVVLPDSFGGGKPAANLNNLSYAAAVGQGFYVGAPDQHGYHVLGIIGATFDDKIDVTGAYPGAPVSETLTLEPVDRVRPNTSDEDLLAAAIKHYVANGGHVVVNTSYGYSSTGGLTTAQATTAREKWLMLIRGGDGSKPNPSIEDRYFHATSAGNNAASLARNNSSFASAALNGDLHNTAVVENRTNGRADPFTAGCLYAIGKGATRGGNISAFGTDVLSYVDAAGSTKSLSGASMASPQVAGYAAYLWSINPDLTSSDLLDVITSNAATPGTSCSDTGAVYLDAYAAVLALDDAAALASTGQTKRAPARMAILDVNGDGAFKDDDAALFVQAIATGGSAFEVAQKIGGYDPTRFDLNGDGKLGGTGTSAFNLDISYTAGRKHSYSTVEMQLDPKTKIQLDEHAATDLQILCYYVYSHLFSGDVAKVEQALQNKNLSCRGTLLAVELRVNDTNPNWSGLPATVRLSNFYNPGNKARFSINGNSATCGNQFPWLAGERGGPIFSSQVETGAVFLGARDVIGMPSAISGPGVNFRNCSSFYAIKTVQDPVTQKFYSKIWVNATGRAVSFGGVTFDWEYQIRYYSGDPLNNDAGRAAVVGIVPNSGNFAPSFNAGNYTLTHIYGPPL